MNISVFANQLKKTNTLKDAFRILQSYLKHYHIFAFSFTYYSMHVKTGMKLRHHDVSDPLRAWHMHYLEQGYADIDRTTQESQHIITPFLWDVKLQLPQAKNKREKRMRLDSISYGIDKGLSIPIYGPNNDFAILTLHQFIHEKGLEKYELHQFEWQNAALFYYEAIRRILNYSTSDSTHLTKREKQCLTLTAQEYSIEEISKELKITPRTVHFHLQNVIKKLGTQNKYQAVIKHFYKK
jgi:LuxR family transcriptional activator of bioluminescence operon